MGEADVLHLLFHPASLSGTQAVDEAVNLVNRSADVKVGLQVVYRLELATGIIQTANNQMTEHLIVNGIEADLVIQRPIHQFGTTDLHLGVRQ